MKNLNDILKESIFSKDLVSNDEELVVRAWLDTFMPEDKGQWGLHWTIDEKNKTIISSTDGYGAWSNLDVNAINQKFNGFLGGYKFLQKSGKEFTKLSLYGDVVGLEDMPSGIEEISIYPPKDFQTNSKVFADINKQLKKLKSLLFVLKDWKIGWKNIDLSGLKIPVNTLYIGTLASDGVVKFNPDLKTDILQIGYNAENGTFENLPIFKTISFQGADFESAKNFIERIKDKGKSNFDKIVVNGRNLNSEEKEAIKNLLKGENSGFSGYTEIIKKLSVINSVKNDKDGTKDRFGESLKPGDIVLVCESASPSYPSFLDVYKGGSQNGRIRTEKQMMVPPRNIIKLNNPKILDLLK